MLKNHISWIFLLIIFFAGEVFSAVSPLSVGIVPPIQFPPSDFTVTGVRLSGLWGRHRNMYGLDVGLLGNITEQDFVGVSASGIFNYTTGNTSILGFQLAGITNVNTNKVHVYGLQIALGANYNSAESTVVGLQLALLSNYSPHTNVYGAQVGLYNVAQAVYGLQIGLVNKVTNLHGIQIGLVNFHDKGMFKISPLINVGF